MRYFMPYRLQSSVTNSHATSSILSCLIFCIDTKQILRYNCVKGSLKCLQLVKFQRHNFIKCKIRPFFRYFEFLFAKQGENMNNPKRITLKHLLLSFSSPPNCYPSIILPSVEMVITCHGMNLPLACRARLTAFSIPPQQGTSIRTIFTLFMLLLDMICVSFSA